MDIRERKPKKRLKGVNTRGQGKKPTRKGAPVNVITVGQGQRAGVRVGRRWPDTQATRQNENLCARLFYTSQKKKKGRRKEKSRDLALLKRKGKDPAQV